MFLDLKLRSKDTITFTVFYMASTGPVKTRPWMTRLQRADGGWVVQWVVRCVRVVVRASGRQWGSTVHDSVRVRESIILSASGQAAEAARKSRDEIRLG